MNSKLKVLAGLSFVSLLLSGCNLVPSNSKSNSNNSTLEDLTSENSSTEITNPSSYSSESSSSSSSSSESEPQYVSVSGISLNVENLPLTLGSYFTLIPTIYPSNATDQTVTFSSDDDNIASVNSNGKVSAVSIGDTVIRVVTNDGNFEATCNVNVNENVVNVTGVSLNYEEVSLNINKTLTLNATLEPFNATNQEVSWFSEDEEVVAISDGVLSPISVGSTYVGVTTSDGGYEAKCLVHILPKEDEGGINPDPEDPTIFQILEAGEYDITSNYKQIYVNAPDAEVTINLNGVTIENDENSPIYIQDCDSVDISAKKNTVNYVKDLRSTYEEDVDGQGKGAIYALNGDLKLKGAGTLNIEGNYYNGIHGKDDVKIQKQTLNIEAVNHAIKGNDSITISSGTLNLTCGGDALHTENSDISSNDKQRGNVTINGGNITINSDGDAIAASYNAIIEEDGEDISIDIDTGKYSSYDGETIETSNISLYLKMNSSTYSNGNYTYAAYINNIWYKAEYKGTLTTSSQGGGPGGPGGSGGSGSTSYIYKLEKPSDATSFKLYRFYGSNVTTFSTSSYDAVSDSKAFNDAYDMVGISVRNGSITFNNWGNYSGNSKSMKGIKANNEVYIASGVIDIKAYDDAIHANNDNSLENGSSPLGNVNISGGVMTLYSDDDAIHADYTLDISGGEITVTSSYEGLEGNLIKISGGSTYVFATDDGVNANSGKSSPNITVSGGYLDVTVPSNGDTDGIDSNGTYTQTGGTVIVKGPGRASTTNFGSAALDTDSTVKITSGTLIVFGGIEQNPSYTGTTKTLCTSATVSVGSHTVSFTIDSYTTTLKYTTSGCIVYSSLGSATLS